MVRSGTWWFIVVCGGLWWFVVVFCGGFVVVCGGLWWFFSKNLQKKVM